MAEDWSSEEVAATVADYLVMLGHQLRGEPYNKKEHNRRLRALLRNRSAGAIEFKHANVSAVLVELDFPYIDGYKPRSNYQELLKDEVVARMTADHSLAVAASQAVEAPVESKPGKRPLSKIIVPAPLPDNSGKRAYERRRSPPVPRIGVNYLEREARNASLGKAGELFVLDVEHRRLWDSGKRRLAEKIEHVSVTKGDGLGYDILSFDERGRERFIEVKTTRFGIMTPFFASKGEVSFSADSASHFGLYRVFKFGEMPQVFVLHGSLRTSCTLDPVQFRASVT